MYHVCVCRYPVLDRPYTLLALRFWTSCGHMKCWTRSGCSTLPAYTRTIHTHSAHPTHTSTHLAWRMISTHTVRAWRWEMLCVYIYTQREPAKWCNFCDQVRKTRSHPEEEGRAQIKEQTNENTPAVAANEKRKSLKLVRNTHTQTHKDRHTNHI